MFSDHELLLDNDKKPLHSMRSGCKMDKVEKTFAEKLF